MSKYFYRIFTIIDLHFGAMQPCSSGLGMALEASDFRSVRRLVAYSTTLSNSTLKVAKHSRKQSIRESSFFFFFETTNYASREVFVCFFHKSSPFVHAMCLFTNRTFMLLTT